MYIHIYGPAWGGRRRGAQPSTRGGAPPRRARSGGCPAFHQQCDANYREVRRATVWSYEFHRRIDGEGMRPYEKLPIPTDPDIVHITLLMVQGSALGAWEIRPLSIRGHFYDDVTCGRRHKSTPHGNFSRRRCPPPKDHHRALGMALL